MTIFVGCLVCVVICLREWFEDGVLPRMYRRNLGGTIEVLGQ